MGNGIFTIKQNINSRSFYAEVEIDAEVLENSILIIEYDHEICKEWRIGIEFGIDFYFHKFLKGGLLVKIRHVRGQIVDTSNLLISFAVIKALEKALNYEINSCSFDDKQGIVSFKH